MKSIDVTYDDNLVFRVYGITYHGAMPTTEIEDAQSPFVDWVCLHLVSDTQRNNLSFVLSSEVLNFIQDSLIEHFQAS